MTPDPGNILAGMNAAQFDMDFEDFQRGAGALDEGGIGGIVLYELLGITYGESPMYGEIEYQYLRSLSGYNLIEERGRLNE